MIAEEDGLNKMLSEMRERMDSICEENEKLKLEREEEEAVPKEFFDASLKTGGNSIIPPRSSSAVELLPHMLASTRIGPKRSIAEELDALKAEHRVLVAYIVKHLNRPEE